MFFILEACSFFKMDVLGPCEDLFADAMTDGIRAFIYQAMMTFFSLTDERNTPVFYETIIHWLTFLGFSTKNTANLSLEAPTLNNCRYSLHFGYFFCLYYHVAELLVRCWNVPLDDYLALWHHIRPTDKFPRLSYHVSSQIFFAFFFS